MAQHEGQPPHDLLYDSVDPPVASAPEPEWRGTQEQREFVYRIRQGRVVTFKEVREAGWPSLWAWWSFRDKHAPSVISERIAGEYRWGTKEGIDRWKGQKLETPHCAGCGETHEFKTGPGRRRLLKLVARGMCSRCYQRWLRNQKRPF